MDPKSAAETYFEAWQAKDWDRLRGVLSARVTFRGPMGEANGVDECVEGLTHLVEMFTELRVLKMMADQTDVLTWYDMHVEGIDPVPTVNWSHVENGKITRIRATFDPRPLLPKG